MQPSQALATTRGDRRFSEGLASPAVLNLAKRVQELTAVVARLGTRMTAQAAELKQASGAFNELRQLRDSIESLVTSRNERQASLERQLGLLTDEIRALRRQVPASKGGPREANLAEAIGEAVRSAVGSNGNGSASASGNGSNGNGHRSSKSRRR